MRVKIREKSIRVSIIFMPVVSGRVLEIQVNLKGIHVQMKCTLLFVQVLNGKIYNTYSVTKTSRIVKLVPIETSKLLK